jgi:site-specific recombinase XerD
MNDPEALLTTLVDLYLLRCEVEGKSPRTVRAYRWALMRFLRILDADGAPTVASRIQTAHLYAYLGHGAGLSNDTRHRYFREVRCFFNWLVDAGYLDANPFRGMRNIRLPQRIVQPFSIEDIAALLIACGDSAMAVRDRALILVMLDTGARCSEVVQLRLEDLDLESRRLRILHAKNEKQRVVSFAERCHGALEEYLEVRGLEPGPLFLASTGHADLVAGVSLQPNGLKQLLRRLGRKTGIPKVHAHRFRHTFATWAIQHDARELDVQYLLGHSSPDMVRRYSSSYGSEQAAMRHVRFSPADQMLQRST